MRIKGRRPLFPNKTPSQEQSRRHGATFNRIEDSAKKLTDGIEVASDPRAVTPDRALVFELKWSVSTFEDAARKAGFEWLASEHTHADLSSVDEEVIDQGESFLYLTMPTLVGLQNLLALWKSYVAGKRAPPHQRAWWDLFGYLKDLRVWSAKDRIEPSVAGYIESVLHRDPNRPVVVEVDLWYRSETQRRDSSLETLKLMLSEVGGDLLDFVAIDEIHYHAALVRIPAHVAQLLATRDGTLAHADEIMTIRPQSLSRSGVSLPHDISLPPISPPDGLSDRCIAALLDGYPVAEHSALSGRIVVHEVDVSSAQAPVGTRHHGTAMASLVLHGDLHQTQVPLRQKIAVVPVLAATPGEGESTPYGALPIRLIYNAVLALKQGVGESGPKEPDVVLINHSICDEYAPFVRRPSPWATLLDHLSHKYRVLFVVSAGNIGASFPVADFRNKDELDDASPVEIEAAIMMAVEKSKGTRGILSPAESVNSITVGALHDDGAGPAPLGLLNPYTTLRMASLCSAVGPGLNRSLKPDLVESGGRLAAIVSNGHACVSVRGHQTQLLGHLVAAPDSFGGDPNKYGRLSGTSNSAALVSRAGVVLADAIEQTFIEDGIDWLALPTRAVILKALLTHGCKWGDMGNILDSAYPPFEPAKWSARRDTISRFLGYGQVNSQRILSSEGNRITLLADDVIKAEELHEYRIPVPSAMLGNRELRRIVITLAWSAPIVLSSAIHRGVQLKVVNAAGSRDFWDGVSPVLQPNANTGQRGTLVHFILEGTKLRKTFNDADGIFVGVQAMALHSKFNDENVPYALAVSLEMGQSLRTNGIYTEVRDAVRSRVTARSRTRTRVGEK